MNEKAIKTPTKNVLVKILNQMNLGTCELQH